MRFWTVLLGLLLVGVIAMNVIAADRPPRSTPEERFAKMDTDKDGKLTLKEFVTASKDRLGEEKATAFFEKMAGGKDKVLTLEQYKKAMEKFRRPDGKKK